VVIGAFNAFVAELARISACLPEPHPKSGDFGYRDFWGRTLFGDFDWIASLSGHCIAGWKIGSAQLLTETDT
jgi:hypothetical protein